MNPGLGLVLAPAVLAFGLGFLAVLRPGGGVRLVAGLATMIGGSTIALVGVARHGLLGDGEVAKAAFDLALLVAVVGLGWSVLLVAVLWQLAHRNRAEDIDQAAELGG